MGTAEYVLREDHVYVQGIAVHPSHRCTGVCRALLLELEKIARVEELMRLTLCVIEETGNVKVFERLGFNVVGFTSASRYISPSGVSVTRVDMKR